MKISSNLIISFKPIKTYTQKVHGLNTELMEDFKRKVKHPSRILDTHRHVYNDSILSLGKNNENINRLETAKNAKFLRKDRKEKTLRPLQLLCDLCGKKKLNMKHP